MQHNNDMTIEEAEDDLICGIYTPIPTMQKEENIIFRILGMVSRLFRYAYRILLFLIFTPIIIFGILG